MGYDVIGEDARIERIFNTCGLCVQKDDGRGASNFVVAA